MTTDEPLVKTMQEINRAFAVQGLGVPVALEGLANILVINLDAVDGEKVAMATLGEIATNAPPVARIWGAFAAAANHELGHV